MEEKIIPRLKLPQNNYGPMCCKILDEFKKFHKVTDDFEMPTKQNTSAQVLSRILDMMLFTLGEEKRNEFIIDCETYIIGLHPSSH